MSKKLQCKICGGKAKLIESRPHVNGSRRRRYKCLLEDCGHRWSEFIGERSEHSIQQQARSMGTIVENKVANCNSCNFWSQNRNGCTLGIPEAVDNPMFAAICAARADPDCSNV